MTNIVTGSAQWTVLSSNEVTRQANTSCPSSLSLSIASDVKQHQVCSLRFIDASFFEVAHTTVHFRLSLSALQFAKYEEIYHFQSS